MLNLLLNVALIVVGLVFIAISVWGKRFYEASWAQVIMGPSHLCGTWVSLCSLGEFRRSPLRNELTRIRFGLNHKLEAKS